MVTGENIWNKIFETKKHWLRACYMLHVGLNALTNLSKIFLTDIINNRRENLDRLHLFTWIQRDILVSSKQFDSYTLNNQIEIIPV